MERPFKSDGCSWWPDGDYFSCCETHDRYYWKGGNWKDRLAADNELFRCVAKASRYGVVMAATMWLGVRLFGFPLVPSKRFRWGYGHAYPRWKPPSKTGQGR